LFVRLPRDQAAALDRLADATGRPKQHLVSELLEDRLAPATRPLSVGRVEVADAAHVRHENVPTVAEDVLTLEDVAALLRVAPDAVRSRAERGDLPGRRFGKEWRFARTAVLGWLADGERHKSRRTRT
jgi:excisionase family DNA binding protein